MTFAPQTLTDLAHLWVSNDGVNLGIVGDQRHTATGTSYHLGRSQLIAGAYSAKLARDVAGLSEAASAIDLGQLHGSLHNLQKFSVWLVYQIRTNPRAYRDIREVIYSPDGTTVLRWDNNLHALRTGGDGTGQGDDTHLYHTHISFFRDAEYRDKRALFAPYFQLPDTATEADLDAFTIPAVPTNLSLGDGDVLYTSAKTDAADPLRVIIGAPPALPRIVPLIGTTALGVQLVAYHGKGPYFVKKGVGHQVALPGTFDAAAVRLAVKNGTNAALAHLDAPIAALITAKKEATIA